MCLKRLGMATISLSLFLYRCSSNGDTYSLLYLSPLSGEYGMGAQTTFSKSSFLQSVMSNCRISVRPVSGLITESNLDGLTKVENAG